MSEANLTPQLSEMQIDQIRPIAKERDIRAGEILYEPNDNEAPFFVVLSGEIEIVSTDAAGEQVVISYGPRQFSGEMTMISGRRSLVQARVTRSGTSLELTPKKLRSLIAKDAELSELFMNTFLVRRATLVGRGQGNAVVLGSRYAPNTLAIREFLTRDGHPFTYLDLDVDREARKALDRFGVSTDDLPIVICNNRMVLRNPTQQEVADCLGFNTDLGDSRVRDLIVVGAGPAGLSAAVSAASEGLDVLVIEKNAPGGQAGSSSKIENYFGFPTGLSGQELVAGATAQAEKFGARIIVARTVTRLECTARPYRIALDNGEVLAARTIVLANGAQYNKPSLPDLDKFTGRGLYYSATFMEAQLSANEKVAVIGGGNAAGQAAVYLSQHSARVHMLVRAGSLSETMSRYLIQRIEENPRIRVHYNTELTSVEGNGHLERISWADKASGDSSAHSIRHVFVMTGASPRTEWLAGCVAMDNRGFLLTGRDLETVTPQTAWPLSRSPYMLETSLPGVFAVGDARSGNVKRVASAVGEGAMAIHMVHQALESEIPLEAVAS
jgi:thioredoxin reductase (NADPH)